MKNPWASTSIAFEEHHLRLRPHPVHRKPPPVKDTRPGSIPTSPVSLSLFTQVKTVALHVQIISFWPQVHASLVGFKCLFPQIYPGFRPNLVWHRSCFISGVLTIRTLNLSCNHGGLMSLSKTSLIALASAFSLGSLAAHADTLVLGNGGESMKITITNRMRPTPSP